MCRTRLVFSTAPNALNATDARFDLSLEPQQEAAFQFTISCEIEKQKIPKACSYDAALSRTSEATKQSRARTCDIYTSNELFNDWINRSLADLDMMLTETPDGLYPYPGVPWFSTPFGRDGLITALQTLWINPDIARGVLSYLAAHQADATIPEEDAEPGKILHEARRGEMAALEEIPFGQYYGSVDATPLFVLLAGAYHERVADRASPNRSGRTLNARCTGSIPTAIAIGMDSSNTTACRPMVWPSKVGRTRKIPSFTPMGNWRTGRLRCARCRVMFTRPSAGPRLAVALGRVDLADQLAREAETLRKRFEEAFWCEDLGTYAIALDGEKKPCRVRTSNPGHCLFSGIAAPDRAVRVARTLLDTPSFSGWGIRTVACGEAL